LAIDYSIISIVAVYLFPSLETQPISMVKRSPFLKVQKRRKWAVTPIFFVFELHIPRMLGEDLGHQGNGSRVVVLVAVARGVGVSVGWAAVTIGPGGMSVVGVGVEVGQVGHGVGRGPSVAVGPAGVAVRIGAGVPVGAGTGGVGLPPTPPGQSPALRYRQSK